MAAFSANQCLVTHVCPIYVANKYPKKQTFFLLFLHLLTEEIELLSIYCQ